MYKTAIDYYKEPVNKTIIYSQYKGPFEKSNESFKHSYFTPIFEKYWNETIVSIANQIELTFENSSTNCKIKKIEYSLDGD